MTSRLLYGLGIEADAPIAALATLPASPRRDVRWNLESMPPGYAGFDDTDWEDYQRVDESSVSASRLPDGTLFRLAYDDGTEFAIDARGTEVWARSAAGATLEDTATYLLGPVMGFVLRLRGVTCLHASAVAIGGRAIAFAGHAGSGKSTLAASFARLGHAVLTDDVTALGVEDGAFHVEPAYPRVRLWPESVRSLFGSADALPRITPTWDKRFLGLDGGAYRFQGRRLPLAAVYVLEGRGAGAGIEPLEAPEALMALIARAYSARLLDKAMRAEEFGVLSRLVGGVPVLRARAPEGLGELPEFCETIAARHANASL